MSGARVACLHCGAAFRRSWARRKYCRDACRRQARRERFGVHASDSPEVAAIRRANGLKVAAARRAQRLTLTCRRCREDFTTPATRHLARYCDTCREIQHREGRSQWKRENRDRHLENKRRHERTPHGRAAKLRRALARYERLIADGSITLKRKQERVCTCGAPFIGQARTCSACTRARLNAEAMALYYADVDRSRAKGREQSNRSWGKLSAEERSDRAWRKWVRRRFGHPGPVTLELLEGLRMVRKDLEIVGLYARAAASRLNGRKGGGPRRTPTDGGARV